MSTDEKVLKKIQKLLTLADKSRNSSEEEAQSALLMAQRLMVENGLSISDVDGVDVEKKPEVKYGHARSSGRALWWYRHLGHIIADNFRCKFLIGGGRGGRESAMFLGVKEDTEIAVEVFNFAFEAIKYHADKFARKMYQQGVPMAGLRDSYTRGFLKGLEEKFQEQVASNNWLAVIEIHPAVVEFYQSKEYGQAKEPQYAREHMNSMYREMARQAGHEEGKRFEVHKNSLKDHN